MKKFALVTLTVLLISAMGVAYAQEPVEAWVATYNGPGNSVDTITDIAVDNQGNVYVTGGSWGGESTLSDGATIKYDANGNQLWVATYNSPVNGYDFACDIALDGQGNVYVGGIVQYEVIQNGRWVILNDWATIKYDANGNELWVRTKYSPPGSIAVDSQGNVYVASTDHQDTDGNYDPIGDIAIYKLDTDNNVLWVRMYYDLDYPDYRDDYVSAIALDNQGSVYVAGISTVFEPDGDGEVYDTDYLTMKHDTNGTLLWQTRYDSGYNDYVYDMALDSAGNACVTGLSYNANYNYDFVTAKYNTNGNQLWVRRYGMPEYPYSWGFDVAIDSQDNVCVTGPSYGMDYNLDFATIKYDANGNQLWVARYDNLENGYDYARHLVVDNQDNVYVTGVSFAGTHNCATVKYDAGGNLLWTVFSNVCNDVDPQLAVDSQGNVYVAGMDSNCDFVTIKYTQAVANQPPVLEPVADQVAYVNVPFELQLVGSDPDNDPLTFSASGLPAGLFCSADGLISGTPTTTGHYPVTASLTDGVNDPVTQSFLLTVCNIKEGANSEVDAGTGTYVSGDATAPAIATAVPSSSNVILQDLILETVKAVTLETDPAGIMTGPVTIRMLVDKALVTEGLESFVGMYKLIDGVWQESPLGTVFLGEVDGSYSYEATFDGLCEIALAIRPLTEKDGLSVKVTPRTMNLKAKGTFTIFIEVPGNIPVSEIDTASLKANGASPASVKLEPHRIIAKFDRQGFDFGDGTVRVVAKRVHLGTVQWLMGKDTVTLVY